MFCFSKILLVNFVKDGVPWTTLVRITKGFLMCSRVGVGERLFEDGLIIEELITKKGLMFFKKEP